MERQSFATRDELWQIQDTITQLSSTQASHTDRLVRIESMLKIEDTSRTKNVWGPSSPFPSILGAGRPALNPAAEAFRNFDADPGISSLSLDNTDDQRRAAASRANSVRFDESANNHYGQSRQSIDLPARTGSGLGSHPLSERSLSHRSDGRASNAGFGRTNSFGLDSSRLLSSIHNSPKVPANPPPGFFVLGPCPSIIRCWLTETFSNSSLLYAAICTGSTLSSVSKSLIEKMGLTDQITEEGGLRKIKLPVYLTEARITNASSRSASPAPQVPTLIAKFVVFESVPDDKSIQIVIGSDVLRSHSADVLLSQDKLMIFDEDRNQLSVPLVRPENDEVFKNLSTAPREQSGSVDFGRTQNVTQPSISEKRPGIIGRPSRLDTEQLSMTYLPPTSDAPRATPTSRSSTEFGQGRPADDSKSTTGSEKSYTTPASKPASGAWGNSWRSASSTQPSDGQEPSKPSSSYSRPSTSRPMKVLRPVKSSATTPRSASSTSPWGTGHSSAPKPEEVDKKVGAGESKPGTAPASKSNPIGSASAFGWL
ncbi:hypothetical protein DV738_g1717, partial [Chaetothyriales sp. CBS 135597]